MSHYISEFTLTRVGINNVNLSDLLPVVFLLMLLRMLWGIKRFLIASLLDIFLANLGTSGEVKRIIGAFMFYVDGHCGCNVKGS